MQKSIFRLTIASAIILVMATTASAIVPVLEKETSYQQPGAKSSRMLHAPSVNKSTSAWENLLSEDFSFMEKGSEEEHDAVMLPEGFFETQDWHLPDALFHRAGWHGFGVYEAGGTCALYYPEMGGALDTPAIPMQGHIKLTAKVRATGENFLLFLPLQCGNHSEPTYANNDVNIITVKPEEGWRTISIETVNTREEPCWFRFDGMNYNNGTLLIDDITIERDPDYVGCPVGLKASSFRNDGFTASWEEGIANDSWSVSLYEKKAIEDTNFISVNKFENIENDWDDTLLGLSEGWIGSVYSYIGWPLTSSEDKYEDSNALYMSNEYDLLIFDGKGSELQDLSFAVKNARIGEQTLAKIAVEFYTASGTAHQFTIPLSALSSEWLFLDFAKDADGFVPGRYVKAKISLTGVGSAKEAELSDVTEVVAFAMVGAETSPRTETKTVVDREPVTTAAKTFDGLDMNCTYSFQVWGLNDRGNESAASEICEAFGTPAPEVYAASDIDPRGSYTANWSKSPSATGYELYSYSVYTCPEWEDDMTIFHETFSPCSEGSESQALYLNNPNYISLDEYTDNAGWTGSGTILWKNMVGCYTGAYDLISPELSLNNNDGNYTVIVDYYIPGDSGSEIQDQLVVQGGMEGYKTIPLTQLGDGQGIINLNGGKNFSKLMFYTIEGTPFLLKDVKVVTNVNESDRLFTLLSVNECGDNDSFRVTGLKREPGISFAYALKALRKRANVTYVSERSKVQEVDLGTDAIDSIDAGQVKGKLFDLTGLPVHGSPEPGIYILKQGNKTSKIFIK